MVGTKYFVCDRCGCVFDEPATRRWREDMNGEGAWYTWTDEYCPMCGCEDFEEVEDDAEALDL